MKYTTLLSRIEVALRRDRETVIQVDYRPWEGKLRGEFLAGIPWGDRQRVSFSWRIVFVTEPDGAQKVETQFPVIIVRAKDDPYHLLAVKKGYDPCKEIKR